MTDTNPTLYRPPTPKQEHDLNDMGSCVRRGCNAALTQAYQVLPRWCSGWVPVEPCPSFSPESNLHCHLPRGHEHAHEAYRAYEYGVFHSAVWFDDAELWSYE